MMKSNLFKTALGIFFFFTAIFIVRNYTKKTETYTSVLKIAEDKTTGYQIYKDNKLIIEQLTVPGSDGSKGFVNQQEAQEVADLVIEKLSKGMFPPTVTQNELDSLHIKY